MLPDLREDTGCLSPALVTRGAELVYLAEELYLRLFLLVSAFLVVGAGLALWFGGLRYGSAPGIATIANATIAVGLALTAARRPRETYRWLRQSPLRQVTPAALAVVAVAVDGPDSPGWWIAMPLLWIVAAVSSTRLATAAAVAAAAVYLVATAFGGEPLIRNGDAGILANGFALAINTLIGRLAAETFARFLLGLHRLQANSMQPPEQPTRIENLAGTTPPTSNTSTRHDRDRDSPKRGGFSVADRLTARQLEAALLARDGLRQAEIASCMAISARQVERLLADARSRIGATTTGQLVAILINYNLAPSTDPAPTRLKAEDFGTQLGIGAPTAGPKG